ncbi:MULTISPECIES: hypothetical protein [Methanorbis]|uniref:Uncharacterized protein n=2 Tax=Methanorbis TaxID=3136059 RepID=A0AAE4MJ30_9EURY|nr:hypothetical protein [Methanocorpusculaceae archaeon Sp1]MDV0442328.1 hypothetical protein [Methanocorpusculaceae archaeon Ag1]MDV0444373.1 hypothetical protein [Methanocorpusculaceae archaeon Cs1]
MIWHQYPELVDRRILWGYVQEGLSVREISVRVGCSRSSVESALKAHGIRRPVVSVPEEMREKLRL